MPKPMMDDYTDFKVKKCVEQRGIKYLVHFTSIEALKHITQDGKILSTERLCPKIRGIVRNDFQRHDGHLDYICCSIQWPNVYLLNKFIENYPHRKWVVLILRKDLLWSSKTMFSPINAATESGFYVKQGVKGFNSLFANKVQIKDKELCRSPLHRLNCPTDIQAEVLVKGTIDTSFIIRAIVHSDEDRKMITPILSSNNIGNAKIPWLFDKAKVCKIVRNRLIKLPK